LWRGDSSYLIFSLNYLILPLGFFMIFSLFGFFDFFVLVGVSSKKPRVRGSKHGLARPLLQCSHSERKRSRDYCSSYFRCIFFSPIFPLLYLFFILSSLLLSLPPPSASFCFPSTPSFLLSSPLPSLFSPTIPSLLSRSPLFEITHTFGTTGLYNQSAECPQGIPSNLCANWEVELQDGYEINITKLSSPSLSAPLPPLGGSTER
jgi:hypothetical protein